MGYSARYHAASLAAVLLALVVGILIGVGFGSDIVTGTVRCIEVMPRRCLTSAIGLSNIGMRRCAPSRVTYAAMSASSTR